MNMVINLNDGSERHYSQHQIRKVHTFVIPDTSGESPALSFSKAVAAGHGIVLELASGNVVSFPASSINFAEVTN